MNIDTRSKLNKSYSGYYEYYLNEEGKEILNEDFLLTYFNSGTWEDTKYVICIEYSGTFQDGLKNGNFIEKLLHNDGVDLYSKWVIELYFSKDKCTTGKFEEIMGHIMPSKKYEFNKLTQCSFKEIVKLAGDEWQKEWERNNKN